MTSGERQLELQNSLYASSNPTRRYLHCTRRDWVLSAIDEAPFAEVAVEIGPGSGVYLEALQATCRQLLVVDHEKSFLDVPAGQPSAVLNDEPLDEVSDRSGHGRAVPAAGAVQQEIGESQMGGVAVSSPLCLLGALPELPLADKSVDLLLCSEVIEHIADTQSQLAELARVLKQGGTLILTTPQPASPLEILGKIAFLPGIIHLLRVIYREPIEPTGHINVVSRGALESAILKAGLVIRRRSTMGFYLPLIGEFGGSAGQRLLAWIDAGLQNTGLSFLLWTQCYVLERSTKAMDE